MKNNTSPLFEDKIENYFIVRETTSLQYPLHMHSYIELVHVMQGTLRMQIGSNLYTLYKGDFAVIFPNVQHDYQTLSDSTHTALAICNCVLSLLPLHKTILLQNRPENPILKASNAHADLQWIEDRLFSVNPHDENTIFVASLFSLFLCHCYPYLDMKPFKLEQSSHTMTEEIISYISSHSLENISLEQISLHLGISRFKLSRFFTNTLKVSFPDYLKKTRINNAEHLLISTNKEITNIAYECGFNNQQGFNRAFKEVEGITPSAFRRKYSNINYPQNFIPLLPNGIIADDTY